MQGTYPYKGIKASNSKAITIRNKKHPLQKIDNKFKIC